MRKILRSVLSVFLCLCFVVGFAIVPASAEYGTTPTVEKKSFFGAFLDEAANFAIDAIHRILVAIRYPWNPTTNTLDWSKFDPNPTFEDNFDGKELDPRKWGHRFPGIRKGGLWDEGQTSVQDGNLCIRAEYKKDGPYGAGYYADRVDTIKRFEQRYGYFEARCKLPAAQGLWSAFWLSSTNIKDYVPGTEGTEIDVFESPLFYRGAKGRNNNLITSNLHYGGYGLGHRYQNVAISKVDNPYTQFNTYGLEWNEDGYIFYINGQETGRSQFGGVSKVPEFLILSIEFDGANGEPRYGWSGKATWNKKGEIPAELLIDYVRVYRYKDTAQ